MTGSEPAELIPSDPTFAPEVATHPPHEPDAGPPRSVPGGSRELLALALPLILSQSFMTVQVLADTLLLAKHHTDEMTASFPAVMWYWLGFGLLSVTSAKEATINAAGELVARSDLTMARAPANCCRRSRASA